MTKRGGKSVHSSSARSSLIQIAIILALFAVLIPQVDSLRASFKILQTANVALFLLALAVSFMTFFWSTFTYRSLAWKKLGFLWTYIVQLSTGFINRLIPAGLGALGANMLYLIRSGHNEGTAASIAITNNILGMLSSTTLVCVSLLFVSEDFSFDTEKFTSRTALLGFVTVVGIVAIAILVLKLQPKLRDNLRRYAKEARTSLLKYRNNPGKLLRAFSFQLLVTTTMALCLIVCALALGHSIDFWHAVIAISAGTLVGSMTPTPGGLGGHEAGIALTLGLFGYGAELSIAIAILFRLCTYWAPILPGYFCYRAALSAKKYF